MTKGKQWTPQQETELKTLIKQNTDIKEIANQLRKTPSAITLKSQHMGLNPQTSGYPQHTHSTSQTTKRRRNTKDTSWRS